MSRPRLLPLAGLLAACLLRPALATASAGADDKLDAGILASRGPVPIFVRLTDQLFRRGGDFASYCRQHDGGDRVALRAEVRATLQAKAAQGRQALAPLVTALEREGTLRAVEYYWIVNGFACLATPAACQALARSDAVAFVYRQRLPSVALHARPAGRAARDADAEAHETLRRAWVDDSATPLDLTGVTVPWNLSAVRADQAWTQEGATGRGVVVALNDTGLLFTPALTAALWRNPREDFNGRDDDQNGYTDDVFGYDFAQGSGLALGEGPGVPHGSICAGIIAGRPAGKTRLITGVAPRAQVMVLRGSGHLKAIEYALAEGADVISMSFMWPGIELGDFRGLYRLAFEHLAAGGVVAVGGAGNFGPGASRGAQPTGHQIALPKDIPSVIAAAGVLQNETQAPASSEGPCYWSGVRFYDDYPAEKPLQKPDVTGFFTGYPMWARPVAPAGRRGFTVVSDLGDGAALVIGPGGNSFSGPHAAGVAALMLSANPRLTAWEVKALMEKTCRDLGAPGRDPKFGAGLLDALAAVRAAKAARN
jgi:subtilisin family serine protease